MIQIHHVPRIQIQHETRIRIHVMTSDLVQGKTTVKEDGGAEVDIILSRPGCLCAEENKKTHRD